MSTTDKLSMKRTKDIDIIDINMILFSSYRMKVNKPYPLIICYLFFFAYAIGNLFRFQFKYKSLNKCLFLEPSLNNRRTLEPIYKFLNKEDYTILEGYRFNLPWSRVAWRSLCFLPYFHRIYNKQSIEDKKLIRHFYTIFITTYGIYHVTKQLLDRNTSTELIVMANDHLTFCRVINMLAPFYGIKTIYTQHASVTHRFPALDFTYSFLDGIDSYDKYKHIAPIRGKVFLSGSPRFDTLKTIQVKRTNSLGIALNSIDHIDKVLELVNYLVDNTDYEIVVRPHPLMTRTFSENFFNSTRLTISNPTEESSFQFLARLNVLIANESSIHLDSLLVGTPTILYNFTNEGTIDWYDYLKNGLILKCNNKEHIINHIKNVTISAEKIKDFYAAYDTDNVYNVGSLIARFINGEISHQEDMLEDVFIDMGEYYDYKTKKNAI